MSVTQIPMYETEIQPQPAQPAEQTNLVITDRKKELRDKNVQKVNDCLNLSARARELIDKKRLRWWKNYNSINDPILRKKDKKEVKGISNLFMPFTLGFVEQRVPRVLGKMPSFNVYGEDQEFDPGWTDAIQQMLRRDLEKAGYFMSAIIHIKQAEIYGWSVRTNFWRYQKGWRRVKKPVVEPFSKVTIGSKTELESYVKWDDPWTECCDIFRQYPQPGALSIEKADWHIVETIASRKQLVEGAITGLYDAAEVKDLFQHSPGISGQATQANTGNTIADNPYWTRLSEIGLYNQGQGFVGEDHFPKHRLITMWTDTEVLTVADDRWLIRWSENPYGRKPFTELKIIPVPFMMEGIGCVGMLEQLQRAINIQENQRIDAINLGINPVVLAPPGVTVDWNNFVMSPGNKIDCSDPERLHWFKPPPVGPDSYQQSRLLLNSAQWLTSISDYLNPSQGSDSELNRTARGVQAIQQQNNVVFTLISTLFDIQDVGPTAQHFYLLRQQFQDMPRMMRVLGPKGYKYVKILPADLAFTPDIKPVSGSTQPADKAQEAKSAQAAFSAFWGNPLAMQLGMDQKLLAIDFLRSLEVSDPERYFSTQATDMLSLIKREHEAMAFGQPVPASGPDQIHLLLHAAFMQSPYWARVPEKNRQLFVDHIQNHQAKVDMTPNSPWFERTNLPEAIEASDSPATHGG